MKRLCHCLPPVDQALANVGDLAESSRRGPCGLSSLPGSENAVPLRNILAAAAIMFLTLSGCATSESDNTSYAQPQGIGPVRGDMGGY
ncbi:hypothetical protein E0H63_25410 [Rhizobium leguminosarum bv. viciae]|nr:hypothetical protein E0H63_25410 [Rhizobium leguminosarum bv. viciae]